LFGSYAKDLNTENSDVDLFVDFDKPIGLDFIEFADYLEKLFNKKVDLITPDGLKNSRLKLNDNQIIYVN
jgi:predicted nucleotidyltransferase